MQATIHHLAETGSTNDDLKQFARDGAAEGTWLRADRQTKGRGRQGRNWDSPIGNLYASTLVRLRESDPAAASLALVAGVALWEAASSYLRHSRDGGNDQNLALKWPNDLLFGGAKLAGILLEREGDCVIIGCGVNLAHHPKGLDRPATSLAAHGEAPPPGAFIETLAAQFADWLARWRTEGLGAVRVAWLERAHPPGTSLSIYDPGGESLSGRFDGLAEDGALRLRLADGAVRVIHAGDVFLM